MAIGENSLLMMLLEFLSFAGRTIQKNTPASAEAFREPDLSYRNIRGWGVIV
jgi:hypothetical protein